MKGCVILLSNYWKNVKNDHIDFIKSERKVNSYVYYYIMVCALYVNECQRINFIKENF